jgi:uncharacterized protein Yka (UPF0111/DUF47 family)
MYDTKLIREDLDLLTSQVAEIVDVLTKTASLLVIFKERLTTLEEVCVKLVAERERS